MTDLLPPGNTPAWADADPANQIAQIWAGDMWPELWPRMIFTYADSAARDADLAGLGPTDSAFAYILTTKQITYWTGVAWVYLTPVSAAKVGKRQHWEQHNSVTTNASGVVNVAHGAGFTPTVVSPTQLVVGTGATAAFEVRYVDGTATSTQATYKVFNGDGTVRVAAITVSFSCFYGE